MREIKEGLQARYGKKNIEILSTPYKSGTHELCTEIYNSVEVDHSDSPSFKTCIPQAMIKMRLK